MGVEAMLEAVDLVKAGKAPRIKQDHAQATYEGRCGRDNARIDWGKPWRQIHNLIRGCNPAPGAWTTLEDKPLQVFEAKPLPARDPKGIAGKMGDVAAASADGFTDAAQHANPRSDIEISQTAKKRLIVDIAREKLGIGPEHLEPYGHYKAKISMEFIKSLKNRPNGKLILVSAIPPTPAGEGKTTTTVGLTDALNHLGKKAMLCLREPSLGPCFGVKGGAAGGGYAQVVPMEDINLHFTGDLHAIGTANNLRSALIDKL